MKPVAIFQKQPRHFWAHVKLVSEGLGYSSGGKIKRYTHDDLKKFLVSYGLSTSLTFGLTEPSRTQRRTSVKFGMDQLCDLL